MSAALVAVTLAAFLVGLVASGYLTNRLTRPLSVLAAAVRRLGAGDLAARARLDGEDEIAQLGREFNTMADHLAEYRSSSLGELLQAQQAAQAAIDSIPDPVLVLRASGALLAANKAAAELFSVDVDGGGDVFADAPAEVQKMVARMREHIAGGRGPYVPKSLEEALPVALRDGTRYFLTRAHPLTDEEARPSGLTILFADVTRLRRFDELKNDLVATVAHEFRTPLTSLRMAIHLCVDGAVGPLTDKQADLLFAAREDCERLQGIVDDLLDLSRIQAGHIELHLRPTLSTTIMGQAVDAPSRARRRQDGDAGARRARVERPVLADPDRVQLVVGNLVQNAIRHTPAGGRVELRCAAARRGAALRGERQRRGHRRRVPAASVRSLLSRAGRAVGRRRPRALHLQGDRRGPRRARSASRASRGAAAPSGLRCRWRDRRTRSPDQPALRPPRARSPRARSRRRRHAARETPYLNAIVQHRYGRCFVSRL